MYSTIAIYRVMRDEVEECLQILKTCSWVYVDVIVTVCSDYYIRIAFLHFLLPLTSPPLPSDPFSYTFQSSALPTSDCTCPAVDIMGAAATQSLLHQMAPMHHAQTVSLLLHVHLWGREIMQLYFDPIQGGPWAWLGWGFRVLYHL